MSRSFRRARALALAGLFAACTALAGAQTLRVGSDVSYAPLEFYAAGTHAMIGFDIDLAEALGQKMGEQVSIANHTFDDLIPAVQKGTFDFAISALSDTRAREAKVDFIDYLLAGSGMLVPSGNPHSIFDIAGLCGLRVTVQRGTSQEGALQEQSKRCVELNLAPIKLLEHSTDEGAFKQFAAGNADVHVTDYPVVAYLAKTNDHKYVVAGRQFSLVPYGIAVSKNDPALRARLIQALQGVIADGTYDRLLKKWGLEQGALRSAPLNAGTLFNSK
ncbi:MAG TPA: ABC transporter substrate-binding protein [Candidatus Baltobacteraceae bacterium]|nr:ABC transporter substrate-binding protein [Candidatus Baltobacteraceae bacterium]